MIVVGRKRIYLPRMAIIRNEAKISTSAVIGRRFCRRSISLYSFALVVFLSALAHPTVAAAEVDYSKLVFPPDARELISSRDRYFGSLEYASDKVLASVKRLYAVALLNSVIDQCGQKGFWSNLANLPNTASLFLQEIRAGKDLNTAFPNSRHIRDALKHGARSIGESDSEQLIAQGICDEAMP